MAEEADLSIAEEEITDEQWDESYNKAVAGLGLGEQAKEPVEDDDGGGDDTPEVDGDLEPEPESSGDELEPGKEPEPKEDEPESTPEEDQDSDDPIEAAKKMAEDSFGKKEEQKTEEPPPQQQQAQPPPPVLDIKNIPPAGQDGKYSKEQIQNFYESVSLDTLPDQVIFGDTEIDIKNMKDEFPEIVNLVRLVSGMQVAKAVQNAMEGVKAVPRQPAEVNPQMAQVAYNMKLASGFQDDQGWVEGVPEAIWMTNSKAMQDFLDQQSEAFKIMATEKGTPRQHIAVLKAFKQHLASKSTDAQKTAAKTARARVVAARKGQAVAGKGSAPGVTSHVTEDDWNASYEKAARKAERAARR